MDVNNAFLCGILEDEVFMNQLDGFIDFQYHNHVCSLNKTLYGLKQVPMAWFERLSSTFHRFGFVQSRVDTSLFNYNIGHV